MFHSFLWENMSIPNLVHKHSCFYIYIRSSIMNLTTVGDYKGLWLHTLHPIIENYRHLFPSRLDFLGGCIAAFHISPRQLCYMEQCFEGHISAPGLSRIDVHFWFQSNASPLLWSRLIQEKPKNVFLNMADWRYWDSTVDALWGV